MRVFVLGGTGTIGTAVVAELLNRNHQVVALSRSEKSDCKLVSAGADPLRGDLSDPIHWANEAISCNAIIQVAATFGDDMGDVDAKAMKALMHASNSQTDPTRLIYTGGCWLYGYTGDEIATEDRPFNPLPSFAWMVAHAEMLIKSPNLCTAVIHPAMVYNTRDGGVFHRFLCAAKAGGPIEIWGSATTRWPLIESGDLARVYCDLAERQNLVGYFNASSEEGIPVGQIASALSKAAGSPQELVIRNVDEVVREHGAWATGPTLDQQMSSNKLVAATGWTPRMDDYSQAIPDMIADLQDSPV
jgi:nucleoside-diphosphate-sugar epimerase